MNETNSLRTVTLDVNGCTYTVQVEKKDTLLSVLRDRLDITGPKEGCSTGDCGACKVQIDGEAVNACTTLAVRCEGKRIVTIEGVAENGRLHPIQEAFVENGAVQCGFCTPGMVISAKALLEKNDRPTRDEVRAALSNNLCRCTGYVKIVDAVMDASDRMREDRDD